MNWLKDVLFYTITDGKTAGPTDIGLFMKSINMKFSTVFSSCFIIIYVLILALQGCKTDFIECLKPAYSTFKLPYKFACRLAIKLAKFNLTV